MKKIIQNMDIFYNINNNLLNFHEKTGNINNIWSFNLNIMNDVLDKEINNIRYKYDYGNNLNKTNIFPYINFNIVQFFKRNIYISYIQIYLI